MRDLMLLWIFFALCCQAFGTCQVAEELRDMNIREDFR